MKNLKNSLWIGLKIEIVDLKFHETIVQRAEKKIKQIIS